MKPRKQLKKKLPYIPSFLCRLQEFLMNSCINLRNKVMESCLHEVKVKLSVKFVHIVS